MKKLLVFLTIAIAIFTTAAFGQDRRLLAQAQQVSGDTFRVAARTPKGAKVYAVSQPNRAMLDAIDRGLTDLFAVAKKNRYRRYLNYSDYSIFIARPDRTKDGSGRYSPDIAVRAAQYAGTEYDKGGFIYAAGMVLGFSPAGFVIAEHTGDLSRVSDVVRYEGEHIVLYHNDRRRYSETADHSRGGAHPILK